MAKADWSCHDVQWHAPGRKRPVGYSTRATSDIIDDIASEGHTISEIKRRLLYDDEGQRLLQVYIGLGYGEMTKAELDQAVHASGIKVT